MFAFGCSKWMNIQTFDMLLPFIEFTMGLFYVALGLYSAIIFCTELVVQFFGTFSAGKDRGQNKADDHHDKYSNHENIGCIH